ncbi:MAG: hypothetical protein K2K34_09325 [Oscillospiraceae bacterium]|nr:hypothetical protein [Oscillospiraceae bacterium]
MKRKVAFLLCIIVSICLASGKSDFPNSNNTDNVSYTVVSTSETTSAKNKAVYIVNVNTGKFHRPDCPSVEQMSEKNKRKYVGDKDDLIADGYEPCKRCDP